MAVIEPPRRIEIDLDAYLELLIDNDIFDPGRWPAGMQEGASLLRRIREIEQACIAEHGAFDFDALPRTSQDEYDATLIRLNKLIEPDGYLPARQFFAQLNAEDKGL